MRTLKAFSTAITKKRVEFFTDKTPEDSQFIGLREKFKNLYEAFETEFGQPFSIVVDGKKKVNDRWLRIEGDISEGEFCSENPEQDAGLSRNRGVVINIFAPDAEKKKKGVVDFEIALSELYRAAIYIDSSVTKKPRYPYCLLYGIYNCIRYSIGDDKLPATFLNVITGIYTRRADFLEKDQGSIDKAISSVKKQFEDVVGDNKDAFSGMMSQIKGGLDELTDDTIDEIASQAHGAVKAFDKTKGGDIKDIIGGLTGRNTKEVEETMKTVGLHENNIRSIINRASGVGSGMSNSELLATIPANDIDSFINGK